MRLYSLILVRALGIWVLLFWITFDFGVLVKE